MKKKPSIMLTRYFQKIGYDVDGFYTRSTFETQVLATKSWRGQYVLSAHKRVPESSFGVNESYYAPLMCHAFNAVSAIGFVLQHCTGGLFSFDQTLKRLSAFEKNNDKPQADVSEGIVPRYHYCQYC